MTADPFVPDIEAARQAHARLSVKCRASFHSPLQINAEIERTAAKGVAEARILTALADGVELTLDDFREECDMGREAARNTLSALIQLGKVEVLVAVNGRKTYRSTCVNEEPARLDLYNRKRPATGTRLAQVLEAAEAHQGSFMTDYIMRAAGLSFERSQNFLAVLINLGWVRRLSLIGRGRPGIYEVIK